MTQDTKKSVSYWFEGECWIIGSQTRDETHPSCGCAPDHIMVWRIFFIVLYLVPVPVVITGMDFTYFVSLS